jgi:hypothetical protein
MRRTRCVLLVLFSAALLVPTAIEAQQTGATGPRGDPDRGFRLEQNYPNPFNPETWIPFELFEDAFVDGRPATVSIRVYNLLLRYVASPTALNHPAGEGTPVIDLEYTIPGRHEAYWDGRDRSGAPVASGVYLLELMVNGKAQTLRMFVTK